MDLAAFLSAAVSAIYLLAAHPVQWLGVMLVFLIAVESLMFIPYVGFTIKLAVAGIVGAQVIAMFAAAASGTAPSAGSLISAFTLPASAQLVLALAAVIPFAAGMLYLYFKGGHSAITFFFGNIFKVKPPEKTLFVRSKYVMQLFALPFTLLAGAVVLKGFVGLAALSAAFAAALANWLPILMLGVLALAFEWFTAKLSKFLPKWAAATVGAILLVVFLGWSFGVMYTVSAKAFEIQTAKNAV